MSAFFPRRLLSALALATLLLAACTAPRTSPTAVVISADPLAVLTYEGDQSALVALDRAIADAGQSSEKLAALSARLLTILRTPTATVAARQAAAQRLALFPAATLTTSDATALWLSLAADSREINQVKLALDHVPGAAVDDIFLRALAAAKPADRLAWVQSIGNRRLAAAVPTLAPLLADSDATLAFAATKALGQIGTPSALTALKNSPAPASPAVVEARLSAAAQLPATAAVAEFQSILATPAAPAHLRAAALHGLLFAEPAAAPARLVTALARPDAALRPVALEAIFSLSSPDLPAALAAALPSYDSDTQVAVLSALGRRGDAAAAPAVSALATSSDAAVRAAALTALGRLPGTPESANLLGRVAAGENSDDAKLARQSLARLTGPAVAATVVAGATQGDTPLRLVYLDALASRNMTDTVPLLLSLRTDPTPAVRIAALASLGELAPFSEQPALLDWTSAAADTAEQARALRALASVSLRAPEAATRTALITSTLDQAPPALALRLLPVLPRLGGPAAADSAARLALRDDPSLATAATATLVRWTDSAGLLPLVGVAEKTTSATIRTAAVDGAVKYLQRSRELASADLRSLVTRLLDLPTDSAARRSLVYLLGRCTDAETLAVLEKFRADPALAADAADALLVLRSNLSGPPALRSSANPQQLPNLIDGKITSSWNVLALATQWIELDFKSSRPFRQLVVDGGKNQYNYPEHLEICVTDDPAHPGAPLASVAGHLGKNVIDFPAGTHGRYLLIRHSKERADSWWTVAELTFD